MTKKLGFNINFDNKKSQIKSNLYFLRKKSKIDYFLFFAPTNLINDKKHFMNRKLVFIVMLFIAAIWQPTHHYLMASGMSMSSEVHIITKLCPFFTILLILMKSSFE